MGSPILGFINKFNENLSGALRVLDIYINITNFYPACRAVENKIAFGFDIAKKNKSTLNLSIFTFFLKGKS